jgi:hypothetical protein
MKTDTINRTLSPIFNQTLVFDSLLIYEDFKESHFNSSKITVEVFDCDNYVNQINL